MRDIITRLGDRYDSEVHDQIFGFSPTDGVLYLADFYNNGGLLLKDNGMNYALQYAAVYSDGRLSIGSWCWAEDEDFDKDATFEEYDEDDFSASETDTIINKIKEIYGQTGSN